MINDTTTPQADEKTLADMMSDESIDEDMAPACKAYLEATGADSLADFEEAYCGEWSNDEAFAQQMAEDVTDYGIKRNEVQWPFTCIDWELAARELMHDYSEQNGYYFRSL